MVEDKVYAERGTAGAKMTNTGCSEVAVVTGNRGPLNGLKYSHKSKAFRFPEKW